MSANTLGQYIIEYRRKNKLTQAALAEILFVSNKTVSRWETGRGEPDLEQLARISELIGVPVAKLIGGADEPEGAGTDGTPAARKRIFPLVVFAVIAALVLASLILPPVLVFACHGRDDVPDSGKPSSTPEIATKFEAEYAHLKAVNPQLDGTDSFVEKWPTASNGMHIAYLGAKGNTVTFEIEASAADGSAELFIAVVSEWNTETGTYDETNFDTIWELYVNDVLVKVNRKFRSPDNGNPYHDFVEVPVTVGLKEGANVIKMVCPKTGDGQYGLNIDYIRCETEATLSWVPYKENKIRPSE